MYTVFCDVFGPEKTQYLLVQQVGDMPQFKMLDEYLPKQKGKVIELKEDF